MREARYFANKVKDYINSWEKKIKGWSHRKKKALIENDFESLVSYAKSYKTNNE